MRYVLALSIVAVLSCKTFGQQATVTVQARKVYAVTGLVNARLSGNVAVLSDDISKMATGEAAEVAVTTDAKYVTVLAFRSMLEPPAVLSKGDKGLYGFAGYGTFAIWVFANDPGQAFTSTSITLGSVPPPSPGPGPAPDPTPDEHPPILEAGFRVLFVVETADMASIPPATLNAIFGKATSDYLNSHCVRSPTGKAEWRVYDPQTQCSADSTVFCKAMQRPRKSLPWLIISTGKRGYEGPVPPTTEALLALLKKYGGA